VKRHLSCQLNRILYHVHRHRCRCRSSEISRFVCDARRCTWCENIHVIRKPLNASIYQIVIASVAMLAQAAPSHLPFSPRGLLGACALIGVAWAHVSCGCCGYEAPTARTADDVCCAIFTHGIWLCWLQHPTYQNHPPSQRFIRSAQCCGSQVNPSTRAAPPQAAW